MPTVCPTCSPSSRMNDWVFSHSALHTVGMTPTLVSWLPSSPDHRRKGAERRTPGLSSWLCFLNWREHFYPPCEDPFFWGIHLDSCLPRLGPTFWTKFESSGVQLNSHQLLIFWARLLPLRIPWLCILGTPILCRFPNLRGPKQLGRAEPCARGQHSLISGDESGAKRTLSWFPFPSPFLLDTLSWKHPCALMFQCLVYLIRFSECWLPFFLLFLSLASLQVLFLSFLVMSFFLLFF